MTKRKLKTTRKILSSMNKDTTESKEQISVAIAKKIMEERGMKMSRPAFVEMCRKNGLAHQVVSEGWWRISKSKFLQFLKSRGIE